MYNCSILCYSRGARCAFRCRTCCGISEPGGVSFFGTSALLIVLPTESSAACSLPHTHLLSCPQHLAPPRSAMGPVATLGLQMLESRISPIATVTSISLALSRLLSSQGSSSRACPTCRRGWLSNRSKAPLQDCNRKASALWAPGSRPAWPKVALSLEISKPRNTTAPFVLRSWAWPRLFSNPHTNNEPPKTKHPHLVDLRQVGREEFALRLVRARLLHTEPTTAFLCGSNCRAEAKAEP